MMSLEKAFGAVLKEYRLSQGMTQEELGFESGLDRTFISLLERGLRQPSLSTIFQLCHALKISPAHMVKEVENKFADYK